MSMSSAAPLTSHHLEGDVRARLLLSTKKIGDIVGEVPQVVDLSAFPPSLEPVSAGVKRSRLPSIPPPPLSAPPPAPDSRPLLYIHVAGSRPAADHDESTTPVTSPTLTVALNLNRQTTKSNDDAARRRKIAKLSRTLGVPVPTELVFPPEKKERRSRRFTTRTLLSSTQGISKDLWLGRTPAKPKVESISHGWVWVGRRHEIPSDVRQRMERSSRVDAGDGALPNDWVSVGKLIDVEVPDAKQLHAFRENPAAPPQPQGISLYRQGKGWSGNWVGSVRDMDQVLKELRGLRLK
ncbi:hypothetical protein C8F04DRAFT_1107406 [Mycena alexandri]|uniref:Uncharacterized protein n=1 Tax=Mycena alexandri TaxID=1745969 RepID=A0AAD6STK8_9AGAR|nr:hypothetical protein C8F04DRAFT_1107406 [Mycena alexandri]